MNRGPYLAWTILLLNLLNSCSQIKPLSRADLFSPEEKLEYLILKTVAPEAAREYLTLTTPQTRTDYLHWFWQNRGAEESTSLHHRAYKARELFGTVDLLGDERILTYIRYGPPHREEYTPKPITTDTSRVYVNPAEIWTYDSLGLQFDFVKIGTGFRQVGHSRFGRNWFPSALEPVDYGAPPPPPVPNHQPINFVFRIYRLNQRNDSVMVELHYGIASNDPAIIPNIQNLIHLEFTFRSRRHSVTVKGWFGFSPDTSAPYVVGRHTIVLPIDNYSVTTTAIFRDGKHRARFYDQLNLIHYVRRAQPCSDIIFYTLIDSTFQSPQFERPDWPRVIPLVTGEIKTGSTCYLLYEIYNLTVDRTNYHRIEATYEIVNRATNQAVIIPKSSRFITGPGTTGVVVERLHTMDLIPGEYSLSIRIRDLNRGKTISSTAQIRLNP
ncbi:MAG: hypothetical protein ACUVUD_01885 [bacterium]